MACKYVKEFDFGPQKATKPAVKGYRLGGKARGSVARLDQAAPKPTQLNKPVAPQPTQLNRAAPPKGLMARAQTAGGPQPADLMARDQIAGRQQLADFMAKAAAQPAKLNRPVAAQPAQINRPQPARLNQAAPQPAGLGGSAARLNQAALGGRPQLNKTQPADLMAAKAAGGPQLAGLMARAAGGPQPARLNQAAPQPTQLNKPAAPQPTQLNKPQPAGLMARAMKCGGSVKKRK